MTCCYLVILLFMFVTSLCHEQSIAETNNKSDIKIEDTTTLIPPDEFFLNKIFHKYGDENIITFEGFEHLLDNLGLGGGVFSSPHELALHRINGSFHSLHDPAHRHKRHVHQKGSETEEKKCLSPKDIIEIYHLEIQPGIVAINPSSFLKLCPAMVYQLDQKSCYHNELSGKEVKDKYLNWIYAGFSVFLISAVGLLGVAVMPLASSSIFQEILHFLVALAIGTLCGDAMLHLLPHALHHHGTSEIPIESHNDPILKCGVVLLTILLFYCLEAIMRIFTGNGSTHNHSHIQPKRSSMLNVNDEELELEDMLSHVKKKKKPMSPIALMVILGDGLHNITDGLAIGAAFSSDPVTGFATALAVFCHELPHELGDFAVLIRSGFSIKRALYYNILSSVLSFFGTAIGLWLSEDHATSSQWIYAATAGTFLYISLADLIPEITANGSGKFGDFCLSFLGIVSGGVIMLSIALYEDKLKYLIDS